MKTSKLFFYFFWVKFLEFESKECTFPKIELKDLITIDDMASFQTSLLPGTIAREEMKAHWYIIS